MLECRRKGIPQAAYLSNGFIDTNSVLDKLEKNSPLIKKIALLNDKERSKFIFQLSGEHWTVSILYYLNNCLLILCLRPLKWTDLNLSEPC